jgi:hypothetical protein
LPGGHNSPTREAAFWAANPDVTHILLLTFVDDKAKDKFWKDNKLDGVPTTLMSSLTPLKTVSGSNGATPSIHRAKHQARAFTLKEGAVGYSTTESLKWDTATVDTKNGKGVYVTIDKFIVCGPPQKIPATANYSEYNATVMKGIVEKVRAAGLLTKYPKIHAFKRSWLAGTDGKPRVLGAGWVKLEDALSAEINTRLKGFEQEYVDFQSLTQHDPLLTWKNWLAAPRGTSLHTLVEELKRCSYPQHKAFFELLLDRNNAGWVGSHTPKGKKAVDFAVLEKKVKDDYPIISLLAFKDRYSIKTLQNFDAKQISAILDYVKLVELDKQTKQTKQTK